MKLLVDEAGSEPLAQYLDDLPGTTNLVSSLLLLTELHCAADRRTRIPVESVNAVLDSVDLIDVESEDFRRAATSRGGLRSADAIHLAVALRVGADELVVYDNNLPMRRCDVACSSAVRGSADRPGVPAPEKITM